ncbi:MAG: type II CAAX endopeptidase family protein [Planctomycetota bacterium]
MKPSTPRVVRVLAATSLRRFWNRVGAFYRRRKKGGRDGTGRKGGRSTIALVLMGLLFGLQSFSISYVYTMRVVETVEQAAGNERFNAELTERVWVRKAPVEDALRPFAVLLTLLVIALLFVGLGSSNQELSQVGWSMEWLFTFPVPTRGLFLAKVGEYALTAFFTWFTFFPLVTTILWNAGYRWWGVPLGALSTLLVAAAVSSLRVLIETYLRKRVPLHRVKNFQAVCTVVGMLLLFLVFALVSRVDVPRVLFTVSDAIGGALLWGPTASVLQIVYRPAGALMVTAWSIGIVLLALRATERQVRDGLVSAGGPYQGTRSAHGRHRPLGGVLSKDLRLLGRDRNFLVQTLVVPALLVVFQFVVNPAFNAAGSPRAVSAIAFGVAAYVLAFGGFRVLLAEQNALWLLFSLPQRLDRLLRRKTVIWGVVAVVYALGVMLYAWRPIDKMQVVDWLAPLSAVGGVFLCAFLAGAMGTIGYDPHEKEIHKKIQPEWSMLYMAVAGMYAFTLATGSLWELFVVNVLTALLVYAVWERVRRRLPYLLDPTAVPTRRIELSDGVLAIFTYSFLSRVISLIFFSLDWPPETIVRTAPLTAAAVTAALSLYLLSRGKSRSVFREVGLRRPSFGMLLWGAALGVALASLGLAYLDGMRHFEWVRELMGTEIQPGVRTAIAQVAVFVAPPIEEFLFRGLLLRGFLRTFSPGKAVVLSAFVFAVIHNPVSFVPVFLVGLCTAALFLRSRSLWPPIALHMVYNAIISYLEIA